MCCRAAEHCTRDYIDLSLSTLPNVCHWFQFAFHCLSVVLQPAPAAVEAAPAPEAAQAPTAAAPSAPAEVAPETEEQLQSELATGPHLEERYKQVGAAHGVG